MADLVTIAAELNSIGTHLGAIKDLLEQSQADAQALQQQAQEVLSAHAQSAQEYLADLSAEPVSDYTPFETVPPGTRASDYPTGGRGFELSDGSLLRWSPDEQLTYIALEGEVQALQITGPEVVLPNGMVCTLMIERLHVTHEAAGIEGLPLAVEPGLIAADRYGVDLPAGERLVVDRRVRTAILINPTGTIIILGHRKAEGIGETVELSPVASTGDWGFRSLASQHQGLLRSDGAIELMLHSGLDLIVTFPPIDPSGGDDPDPTHNPCDVCGLEHR